MRLDVRHRDEKGLNAVIGMVVIFILTKLWLSGDLATWFALVTGWFRGVESTGFSSATFAIVELVTSLVYGIGAVAVLAWSGIIWLVRDIAAAVRLWRERNVPADEVAEPIAIPAEPRDPVIDAIESLAIAVNDLAKRMDSIEAGQPNA